MGRSLWFSRQVGKSAGRQFSKLAGQQFGKSAGGQFGKSADGQIGGICIPRPSSHDPITVGSVGALSPTVVNCQS